MCGRRRKGEEEGCGRRRRGKGGRGEVVVWWVGLGWVGLGWVGLGWVGWWVGVVVVVRT